MRIEPLARGRRRIALFLIAGLFIGGCGPQQDAPIAVEPSRSSGLGGKPGASRDQSAGWVGPRTLTVAPGVHVLGDLFPSAAFAIETKEGVVLIDSGGEENATGLRESLLAVGLDVQQIRYILVTHAHYDHVFGINKLREVSGAVVCAGREDCEVLRAGDAERLFSVFPKYPYSGQPIEVDRELEDGDIIELGDAKIRVIGTPGHTPGSVCYLLEKDSQRILFSGDTIASLNFGPATYPVHVSPRFRGDAESYLNTIDRLLGMHPPDLLLVGHPQQQTRLQTIRMDEDNWVRLLEPAKAELQQTVRRHQEDGADFLDDAAKEIEPDLYYLGKLDGIAAYGLVDGNQLVVINAPGGSEFSGHLSAQLQSLGLPENSPSLVLLTSEEEACRSGLVSLPKEIQVVAPQPVRESLRAEGIDAAAPDDLEGRVSFPIEAIPLKQGLGYSLSRGAKRILVTPKVPRKIAIAWENRLTGQRVLGNLPQAEDWSKELAASPDAAVSDRESLQSLADFSPDVWLPAMPLIGQNANLYDDDWDRIIETNLRHLRRH